MSRASSRLPRMNHRVLTNSSRSSENVRSNKPSVAPSNGGWLVTPVSAPEFGVAFFAGSEHAIDKTVVLLQRNLQKAMWDVAVHPVDDCFAIRLEPRLAQ